MAHIFRHAVGVLIWLGNGDGYAATAVSVIREIARYIHARSNTALDLDSWTLLVRTAQHKYVILDNSLNIPTAYFTTEDWQCVWRFYESEWFFRVWVIQEARHHAAITVLCGAFSLPWNVVGLVASWAYYRAMLPQNIRPTHGLGNARFIWDQQLRDRCLNPSLALLERIRDFSATDARDKVFAILDHAIEHTHPVSTAIEHTMSHCKNFGAHLDICPDYAMSKYDVYRLVALRCMERYCDAAILYHAWPTAHLDQAWPSWVPRWDAAHSWTTSKTPAHLYAASGKSRLKYRPTEHERSICLQGLVLGTIQDSCAVLHHPVLDRKQALWSSADSIYQDFNTIMRLVTRDRWNVPFDQLVSYLAARLSDSGENAHLDMTAITCDHCGFTICRKLSKATNAPTLYYHCDICADGDYDICLSCYVDLDQRCKDSEHTLHQRQATSIVIPHAAVLLQQITTWIQANGKPEIVSANLAGIGHYANFFKVAETWLGISSGNIKEGDIVAIVFGATVPFIFRKRGKAYRLIADCYIDGMMDGEAIKMSENGELEVQELELC